MMLRKREKKMNTKTIKKKIIECYLVLERKWKEQPVIKSAYGRAGDVADQILESIAGDIGQLLIKEIERFMNEEGAHWDNEGLEVLLSQLKADKENE